MNGQNPLPGGLFSSVTELEIDAMVRETGGDGSFAVTAYLRRDGFQFTFNLLLMGRLERAGMLDRFAEMFAENFTEALKNATQEIKRSIHSEPVTGNRRVARKMSGLPK